MPLGLRTQMLSGYLVVFLLVVLLALFNSKGHELERLVLDMQTGVRGFLITGSDERQSRRIDAVISLVELWRGSAVAPYIAERRLVDSGASTLEAVARPVAEEESIYPLLAEHLHPSDRSGLAKHLARFTPIEVIEPGRLYVAPANHHLPVEHHGTIALSVDAKVNWSRPSIDVLFECVARVAGSRVIAVILSGASSDGAWGVKAVRQAGGTTIAQEPGSAGSRCMPDAAIGAGAIDRILSPEQIGEELVLLTGAGKAEAG